MITSIVFDVDDTIYDQQAPYRIAMGKCFPDFDMAHINQAYIRFRHYSDVGFPRVMAGEWTTEYFRFWRCKETLLEFGYREIDEETGNHFQEVYEHELENITMLDEMRMTLDFLKEKKVPMGIITNGPTEHQLKKVKKLGLYDYVDPKRVIVSQATGFQKPEKEIFNLAAEQFDMNPSTTLYVGDSMTMMSWEPSMVVGIRCGLTTVAAALNQGLNQFLIWKSIISSNFSELSRYFSTFLITNIFLILTIKKIRFCNWASIMVS